MDGKDIAAWCAIAVNFALGCYNLYRTSRNWRRDKTLTRLKDLHDPVSESLMELREVKSRMRTLQLASPNPTKFVDEVKEINESLSKSYNKLNASLEILDASVHSKRNNWASKAEEKWDELLTRYNDLYDLSKISVRKTVLTDCVRSLDKILTSIQSEIDKDFEYNLKK